MFLDDKLKEIINNTDLEVEAQVHNCIKNMIDACFENINEQLGNNKKDSAYIVQFNRVDKTWQRVIDETQNKIISRDGFRIVLKEKKLDQYLK